MPDNLSQPDLTTTGSVPTNKSGGFWGVLRNRVLPQVGPAASRLAMMFGSRAVREGAQAGIETDIAQKEENARQAMLPYQLSQASSSAQEAAGNVQMLPSRISEAASTAIKAGKQAQMEPGSIPDFKKLEEVKATAPITGLMDLSNQVNQPQQPPPVPDAIPGSSPTPSPAVPGPVAGASSTPSVPSAPDIVSMALAKATGGHIVGKDPVVIPNSGGKLGRPITMTNGQLVGYEPAENRNTATLPPKSLIPYYPAGTDLGNPTPEQMRAAADAYNTHESTSTHIQMITQADGSIVEVPVTQTSTTNRPLAPLTQPKSAGSSPAQPKTPKSSVGTPMPLDIQKNIPPQVRKAEDDYNQAQTRSDVMKQSYQRVQSAAKEGKVDQQAMINIVANHLGMTAGIQKGSRINQALWSEAMSSAPWLEAQLARFTTTDPSTGDRIFTGLLSGVTITDPQMKQMLNLAVDRVSAQKAQLDREIAAAKSNYGMSGSTPVSGTNASTAGGSRPPGW